MCTHTIYKEAVVCMISLAPTYYIIWYENILFDIRPLASGHNQSINFYNFTNFVAHTRNLQDIKQKHANQSTKKFTTPCYIHVLPLLSTVVRHKSFSKMHTYECYFGQC